MGIAWASFAAAQAPRQVTLGRPDARPAPSAAAGEAELSRILSERPPAAIIEPDNPRFEDPALAALPQEGTMIIDRRCRLVRDEGSDWWIIRFDDPSEHPLDVQRWVLPNHYLEEMERLAQENPQVHFRVSGENFVFEERPFVLLTKVLMELPSQDEVPAVPAATGPVPAQAASSASAQSDPQAASADTRPRRKVARVVSRPSGAAQADEVLAKMLTAERTQAILSPVDAEPVAPAKSVAPRGNVQELRGGSDDMIVDRAVRMIQSNPAAWWFARFESDNTLQEPPIHLLPCSLLEKAARSLAAPPQAAKKYVPRKGHMPVAAIATEAHIGVYKVSGVITHYKGKQYLLLRKCIHEPDLGQY